MIIRIRKMDRELKIPIEDFSYRCQFVAEEYNTFHISNSDGYDIFEQSFIPNTEIFTLLEYFENKYCGIVRIHFQDNISEFKYSHKQSARNLFEVFEMCLTKFNLIKKTNIKKFV